MKSICGDCGVIEPLMLPNGRFDVKLSQVLVVSQFESFTGFEEQ